MIPYAAAPVPFIFMNDLRYLFPNRVQIDKISFFTVLLFYDSLKRVAAFVISSPDLL